MYRDNRFKDEVWVTPTQWGPRGEAVFFRGKRRMLIWEGIPSERSYVRIEHKGQNQDHEHT